MWKAHDDIGRLRGDPRLPQGYIFLGRLHRFICRALLRRNSSNENMLVRIAGNTQKDSQFLVIHASPIFPVRSILELHDHRPAIARSRLTRPITRIPRNGVPERADQNERPNIADRQPAISR